MSEFTAFINTPDVAIPTSTFFLFTSYRHPDTTSGIKLQADFPYRE